MRKYLPLFLLAFSVPALAHPGHGTDSFQAGFLHPLTGLDHLLMLTGAGVLSALSGRKLLLPLATLGMMLAGAVAGSLLGGFSGMESSGNSTSRNIQNSFLNSFAKIAAGAYVLKSAFSFGAQVAEAAGGAMAMEAQFSQTFGDLQGEAKNMISGMSKDFNILPNRIQPLFTSISSKFLGLGYSSEESMKLANRSFTMAADCAAFYDQSVEGVNRNVTSWLVGHSDAGAAIGLTYSHTCIAAWSRDI